MDIEDNSRPSSVSSLHLWFGLTAAAVAWVVLGLTDIIITWRACVHHEQFGNASTHPDARVIYIVAAVSLFVVVVVAGTLSYRNWRTISSARQLLDATASDRREFMALLGVFVSATLGFGVLWLSIPPLVIEFCLRAK